MNVLIVDDTQINRMLTARILEKRGHRVRTAENGMEAIEELAREDFDLVLMDIRMPGMSGIEAARIIRSSGSQVRRHDVPILAFTAGCGGNERESRNECINAGMTGYLEKPISLTEFIKTVEQYEA